MKQIKSIVCDLDGTLMGSLEDISRHNRNAIHSMYKRGLVIGIASGRRVAQIERFLEKWDLKKDVSFIVGSNGCEYKNCRTGAFQSEGLLDTFHYEKACSDPAVSKMSVGAIYNGCFCWNRFSLHALVQSLMYRLRPCFNVQAFPEEARFVKLYAAGSKKNLAALAASFQSENLKTIPVGKWSVEFVSPSVSKLNGFLKACQDFHLNPREVLYFGDDYNDLEIMEQTEGVAMKNGVPAVKNAARSVTKYNSSQDGVAYHLNMLLLGNEYDFSNTKSQTA